MAGDHIMNADEAKIPTGWVARVWLAVRRGFGLLPRMYWWYAMGCVVVFSVAWPQWELINHGGEKFSFGVPYSMLTHRPHARDPGAWCSPDEYLMFFGTRLVCNLLIWAGIFLAPVIIGLFVSRCESWLVDAKSIAWRYLLIVTAIVLVGWPPQLLGQSLVWNYFRARFYQAGEWARFSYLVMSVVLGVLVLFCLAGLVRRLWRISPFLARLAGAVILMTFVGMNAWVKYEMWSPFLVGLGCVAVFVVIDGALTVTRYIAGRRRL